MAAALAGCAEQRPFEIRLAHATPPGSLIALAAEEFARIANERLVGATVVVYGSGQLGDDQAVLQRLRLGTLEMAVPSTVM